MGRTAHLQSRRGLTRCSDSSSSTHAPGTAAPSADELRDGRGDTRHSRPRPGGRRRPAGARARLRTQRFSAWPAATARSPRSRAVAIERGRAVRLHPVRYPQPLRARPRARPRRSARRARRLRRGRGAAVDVGRVGDRLFLNNVSLGLYALLVHRREHHRRRRDALARLRALALSFAAPPPAPALHDRREAGRGRALSWSRTTTTRSTCCRVGERERLDEGRLHLYVPHGLRRITWEEQSCTELEIGSPLPRIRAAVDGEPVELDTPLQFRVEPRALRVLVPRTPE